MRPSHDLSLVWKPASIITVVSDSGTCDCDLCRVPLAGLGARLIISGSGATRIFS